MDTISIIFLKGLLIGMSISLGPVAVVCIRRTLHYGALSGIFSGLGAATADALYATLACFGINFLNSFIIRQQKLLSWVGAIFLGYLGMKIFFSKPKNTVRIVGARDALGMYASTFFLTIGNPMAIFAFTALFAGFGLTDIMENGSGAVTLITGVFFGAIILWSLLVILASTLRSKIDWRILLLINKASGVILILFAFVILLSLKYPVLFPHLR